MRASVITLSVALSLLAGRSAQLGCGKHADWTDSPRYPYEGEPYPGQFPWFGIVYHRKANGTTTVTLQYACGGTLISARHVITARVCVTDGGGGGGLVDSGVVVVRLTFQEFSGPKHSEHEQWLRSLEPWDKESPFVRSISFGSRPPQYCHVVKIHQPVDHSKPSGNELVILELVKDVYFDRYVQPICLQTNDNLVRPDTVFGWSEVDGGELDLEEFQSKPKRCLNRRSNAYFDQTEICAKDRGSIGISVDADAKWHVQGIIDCTSPPFVPCKKEPNLKTVALIKFSAYKLWIRNVTNLDYLQDVTTAGKRKVPTGKPKSNQKFTFKCGQRTVNHPEQRFKQYEIDPYLGQWPWFGIVDHRKPNRTVEYACGGALISEKFVLTTKLCVTRENGSVMNSEDVLFRIGTHMQDFLNVGFAQHRHVFKIHKSNEYKIVILELGNNVTFNDYVQPICAGKRFSHWLPVVIGWGAAAEESEHLGQFKHKRCPYRTNLWYHNTTDICVKDRGSISVRKKNDGWYLDSFVECSYQEISDQCESSKSFISLDEYLPWIALVTNIDYLQIIRKGQEIDKSKQYRSHLPRLNCGQTLAKYNESDPNARLYKYPWIARILLNRNEETDLTGSLINHRYVLTAAKVFDGIGINEERSLFVRLGENAVNQDPNFNIENEHDSVLPARDYDVEYVVKHKRYRDGEFYYASYDIALIRTQEIVLFEDHIHPVCLPVTQSLQQLELPQYIFPGCKYLSKSNTTPLEETIVNRTNCLKLHHTFNYNHSAMLCTEGFHQCAKLGAPLGQFVTFFGERFVQFGVNLVNEFGQLYRDMVYTNVASFLDWIIANMDE